MNDVPPTSSTSSTAARLAVGVLTVAAGAATALGAQMPWLTTFAGLVPLPATEGAFGVVLVVLGVLVAASGLLLLWRETAPGRWLLLLAALTAFLLSGWVLVQGEVALDRLAADPLLVAGRGPGGLVTLASAGVALALALVPLRRGSTAEPVRD